MRSVNILLLDDNAADRRLAETSLRREKVVNKVFLATNPEEAIHVLSGGETDLVLVDIDIGGHCGLGFIEDAKKRGVITDQIVVVLSGSQDASVMAQADHAGVSLWIDKPLNFKKLEYIVQNVPELFFSVVTKREINAA